MLEMPKRKTSSSALVMLRLAIEEWNSYPLRFGYSIQQSLLFGKLGTKTTTRNDIFSYCDSVVVWPRKARHLRRR